MAEGLNKQYRTLRVVPEDKRDVKYGDSRLDGVSVDVAKFKPIAEKIKELQIAQRDDGREDQKKLAEMYADVTAHRVWKIVNQLASQLNQKLDEQADGWQDDAKKLLKDQLKEIEKLVASGAKTLQQAVQGAPVVKEIVKEVQKLVQPLSDKVDKLASKSASSESKTSGSDSGASGTKPGSKPASKTDSSSPADVAVPAALAAIAQRISQLQQSIDGKIMSAFGKQNSLSLRVAEMVENIDKNLVGAGTGKAVQRKLNYAQYKVDSKAYSPIVRTTTPNKKKSGGLLMGFGAGLELGKALPGLLAKAIIGLPVLAVAWLGKKIFSFAGKALAWLFKPLQGALKFLVGAVGMILAPIKFIFGVLSTIGGVILGVVSVALKGVFVVLGGIFKLATGIAKGVFKVVAGIFSFVPKAITWGFKTAFSMLKGIWGGVKSIWNWTKESIKSPGKIYKIAFIAGFVYGFIIKQIKKHGFSKWLSTVLGATWEGIKVVGGFLWDSAKAFADWLKDQWNEHLKPAIVGWWNTWEPESKFGKFIKNNVNWVISLFQDGNFFGKDGTMSKCVDSIKKWFEPGGFFGEGGTFRNWWSTLFGDENKQGVISRWIDRLSKWFDNGDDAKIDQVVQMQKDLAARNGKPMSKEEEDSLRKTLSEELGKDRKAFCEKYGIEDKKNIFTSIFEWVQGVGKKIRDFFDRQLKDFENSDKSFGEWLKDKFLEWSGDLAKAILNVKLPIATALQKIISSASSKIGGVADWLIPDCLDNMTIGHLLGIYVGYHAVHTAIGLALLTKRFLDFFRKPPVPPPLPDKKIPTPKPQPKPQVPNPKPRIPGSLPGGAGAGEAYLGGAAMHSAAVGATVANAIITPILSTVMTYKGQQKIKEYAAADKAIRAKMMEEEEAKIGKGWSKYFRMVEQAEENERRGLVTVWNAARFNEQRIKGIIPNAIRDFFDTGDVEKLMFPMVSSDVAKIMKGDSLAMFNAALSRLSKAQAKELMEHMDRWNSTANRRHARRTLLAPSSLDIIKRKISDTFTKSEITAIDEEIAQIEREVNKDKTPVIEIQGYKFYNKDDAIAAQKLYDEARKKHNTMVLTDEQLKQVADHARYGAAVGASQEKKDQFDLGVGFGYPLMDYTSSAPNGGNR